MNPTTIRSSDSALRIAVFGSEGRMGSTVASAVENDERLALVASLARDTPRESARSAEIMVDFTVRESALENVRWALEHGIRCVVGTSGIEQEDLAEFRRLLEGVPDNAVLVVPNFSVSALLARRFARTAAEHFDSVEIIEYYSSNKVDAPSGTAVDFAHALEGTRAASGTTEATASRGATIGGVPVHAIRMAGFVSRQDIIFGNGGEFLTLTFETVDRAAYMDGVVRAALAVKSLTGLHVGLGVVIN